MSDGKSGVGVGDVLGEFRILRKLGEGGMGVVFLARDERLERRVALKVIAPQLARDEDFRTRFISEARSAAAIDHPNVVTVFSSGTSEGELYMAMRYIEGTDLRSALSEHGKLEPEVAVEVIGEVAAALDAAHAAGMVHRDVKPANILLEGEAGEGASYLTDFGLTKGGGDSEVGLTGTGQWVGTIDYVAPEQIQGGRIDARTDVYALGCVLYEALTGTVPFAGNDMQKMWGHVNEPFPRLEGRGPAALAEVIEEATAKDPEERFASAGDLARAARAGLGKTVTGRGPVPRREQPTTKMAIPPPRAAGRQRRSWSATHTVAIVVALLLAAGVIAAAVILAAGGDEPSRNGGTTVVRPGAPAGAADAATAVEDGGLAPGLVDWPGGSAYSALVGAFSSEQHARVWQQRALDRGLEAGVLYSGEFSSLRAGYWVVFSGAFAEAAAADDRALEARRLGFPGSYAKLVAP